ncbi:MAG TPA: site-2 protease family protein [Candidatus Eremiobacteraceae bacterium]|nr:site-2 protease family protein [Candidatus Eremiobacteraceae bacterium]
MLVRSSWRVGSIAGIDIAIHPSWIVIYALSAFASMRFARLIADSHNMPIPTSNAVILGMVAALVLFVCVVLHEVSHAVVARRVGVPIGNITLFLFGGVASILREPGTPSDEVKIAGAGPLASLMLAAVFGALAEATGLAHWSWVYTLCLILAVTNLVLAIFNLLPAFPSDGGRLLRAALWRFTGSQARATGMASTVSAVVAALLIVAGAFMAFNKMWNGIWLVLIALFLLQAAVASGKQARISLALERMSVDDCMARTLIPVAADAPLTSFVAEVSDGNRTGYPVVDNGAFVGLVNPRDTGSVPPGLWPHTPVRAIMTPAAKMPALSVDAPASDALAALAKSGARSLPVFENGELTGVVSEDIIFSALRDRTTAAATAATAT